MIQLYVYLLFHVYLKITNIIYLQLGHEMKGLWLNEVFLKMLDVHYTTYHVAAKIPAFGEPKNLHPIGTMGLCAASVESIELELIAITYCLTG